MSPIHERKKEYVKKRKRLYKEHCANEGIPIDIKLWRNLVAQWEFDYEMEVNYNRTHANNGHS